MPPLLVRFPLCCSASLPVGLGSCPSSPSDSASAGRSAGLGTHRLVSPFSATSSWPQVPVPEAARELRGAHPSLPAVSPALPADVMADYVDGRSGTAQLGYQRRGVAPLRQTNAAGNPMDDVRAH